MKYILIAVLCTLVLGSCSKSNDIATKNLDSNLTGTWHNVWQYAIKENGDTIYSNHFNYNDQLHISLYAGIGKGYPHEPSIPLDTIFYYRIIGDTLFYSNEKVLDHASTSYYGDVPGMWDGYREVQGWHIDLLSGDSMKLSMYGLEYIAGVAHRIFIK